MFNGADAFHSTAIFAVSKISQFTSLTGTEPPDSICTVNVTTSKTSGESGDTPVTITNGKDAPATIPSVANAPVATSQKEKTRRIVLAKHPTNLLTE